MLVLPSALTQAMKKLEMRVALTLGQMCIAERLSNNLVVSLQSRGAKDCTTTQVSGCSDMVRGWRDSVGRDCPTYVA